MTDSHLRLECLRQAIVVIVKQPGNVGSGDVIAVAQKFFEWVTEQGPGARDMEAAE